MRRMCEAILGNPTQAFVPQSRAIAVHLFNHLDGRTSPGDLVVATFTEGQEEARWLALLEMDPSEGVQGERVEVAGRWMIELVTIPEILPTTGSDLQKCAFIVPLPQREDCDLKVLDQQNRRYSVRRVIASFFSRGFLQCQVLPNRRDKTYLFVTGSREWLNANKEGWSDADVRHFSDRLESAVRDQMISVTAFAGQAIPDEDDQEAYTVYMRETKGLEDLNFRPDPDERKRQLKTRRFKGDHGLSVKIDAEAVGPGKRWDEQ